MNWPTEATPVSFSFPLLEASGEAERRVEYAGFLRSFLFFFAHVGEIKISVILHRAPLTFYAPAESRVVRRPPEFYYKRKSMTETRDLGKRFV